MGVVIKKRVRYFLLHSNCWQTKVKLGRKKFTKKSDKNRFFLPFFPLSPRVKNVFFFVLLWFKYIIYSVIEKEQFQNQNFFFLSSYVFNLIDFFTSSSVLNDFKYIFYFIQFEPRFYPSKGFNLFIKLKKKIRL